MLTRLKQHIRYKLNNPDEIIEHNYLCRWHLIPRNRFFNIYLHKFTGNDDYYFHDHPWSSISFLIKGYLREIYGEDWRFPSISKSHRYINHHWPIYRPAKFSHRLEIVKGPVWTLFITGPKTRNWGFYTPAGWVKHDER